MAPNLAQQILDRFGRAESSTGSGLGPAIAAEIVAAQGRALIGDLRP